MLTTSWGGETLAAAQRRDTLERFRVFAGEYQEPAVRLAFRMLGGDRAAAEDVAQEAFLRAYKGLAGFRGEAKLRTWFYRILVREVQRHRRWQKVRKVWSTSSLSELELPDPQRPGDPTLRDRMVAALESLSPRQREAVVLVHLEQFTVNETAEMLGTSPGTVKTHVHRGLAALRKRLGDFAPIPARAS